MKNPGVYTLGRFTAHVPPTVDLLDEAVIYFGETCGQTLETRLWQFHRSAFLVKDGHSGGWTYRERFGDQGEKLWVAVFPVTELDDVVKHLFIRFTERRLIWEWAKRHGKQPICNSK